jgi:hypothetical protein
MDALDASSQTEAGFKSQARLGASPGIWSEDVFVSLVKVSKENWSLATALRNTLKVEMPHPM